MNIVVLCAGISTKEKYLSTQAQRYVRHFVQRDTMQLCLMCFRTKDTEIFTNSEKAYDMKQLKKKFL